MNLVRLILKAPTAYRDALAIEDAIKHRDRSLVAAAITALIVFAVNFAQGTPYAHFVDFITPAMATQLGLLVAGLCVSWGHWATGGVLAAGAGARPLDHDIQWPRTAVAGAPGDAAASGEPHAVAPVGGPTADAVAAVPVRGGPQATGPAGDFMP